MEKFAHVFAHHKQLLITHPPFIILIVSCKSWNGNINVYKKTGEKYTTVVLKAKAFHIQAIGAINRHVTQSLLRNGKIYNALRQLLTVVVLELLETIQNEMLWKELTLKWSVSFCEAILAEFCWIFFFKVRQTWWIFLKSENLIIFAEFQ